MTQSHSNKVRAQDLFAIDLETDSDKLKELADSVQLMTSKECNQFMAEVVGATKIMQAKIRKALEENIKLEGKIEAYREIILMVVEGE